MSISEHTKEPWGTMDLRPSNERITLWAEPDKVICRIENRVSGRQIDAEDEANARRIVACVNACAGIDTEYLEEAVLAGAEPALYAHELMLQRDELLAALKTLVNTLADQDEEGLIEHAELMIAARAAIAKVEGTQ